MHTEKEIQGNTAILKLDGRLDSKTSPEFQTVIFAQLDENQDIVLDMEKLVYISSAGLRVILSTQKKATAKSIGFKLIKVSESVMEVLDVVGFLEFLTVE